MVKLVFIKKLRDQYQFMVAIHGQSQIEMIVILWQKKYDFKF